jgi:hypothetical protein
LREECLPATVFVSGRLVEGREGNERPFDMNNSHAKPPSRKEDRQMGEVTTKNMKHTKGCLKAGSPSGIPLGPSFVVIVVGLSAPSAPSVVQQAR